jgi:sulfite reductase beta subunit-like hemoprotein
MRAAIRVYNRYGRRDNKYKARIKILVKAIGAEKFAAEVEEEWKFSKDGPGTLTQAEFDRVAQYFQPPAYEKLPTPTHRSKSTCSRTRRSHAGSTATCTRTRCRAMHP